MWDQSEQIGCERKVVESDAANWAWYKIASMGLRRFKCRRQMSKHPALCRRHIQQQHWLDSRSLRESKTSRGSQAAASAEPRPFSIAVARKSKTWPPIKTGTWTPRPEVTGNWTLTLVAVTAVASTLLRLLYHPLTAAENYQTITNAYTGALADLLGE